MGISTLFGYFSWRDHIRVQRVHLRVLGESHDPCDIFIIAYSLIYYHIYKIFGYSEDQFPQFVQFMEVVIS